MNLVSSLLLQIILHFMPLRGCFLVFVTSPILSNDSHDYGLWVPRLTSKVSQFSIHVIGTHVSGGIEGHVQVSSLSLMLLTAPQKRV